MEGSREDTPLLRASHHLHRPVTLPLAVGIVVNQVVGSSIYVSIPLVAVNAGSVGLTLCLLAASALYSIGLGLCYGELGSIAPTSGGDYVFLVDMLGVLPGFVSGWFLVVIAYPAGIAPVLLTGANYLAESLGIACNRAFVILVCLLIACGVLVLNVLSTRRTSQLVGVASVAKVIVLVVLVGAGIVRLIQGNTENFISGSLFSGTNSDITSITASIVNSFFSFSPAEGVTSIAEEMVNPQKFFPFLKPHWSKERDVPLSLLIGMSLVAVVYSLVMVSFFTVFSPSQMADSATIGMAYADQALGPGGGLFVSITVAVTCVGTMAGSFMLGSRYLFAAARQRTAPALIAMLHTTHKTPLPALLVLLILCLIYLGIPSLEQMIIICSIPYLCKHILVITSLGIYKFKHRNETRPFQVPVCIMVFLVITHIAILGLNIYTEPVLFGVSALVCACAVPAYFLAKYFMKIPSCMVAMNYITHFLQKLFLVTPEV